MRQSRLTNNQRLSICQHQTQHPMLKQKDLQAWVKHKFGQEVSVVTISNILKRNQELEGMSAADLDAKRPRVATNPQLEEALALWILQCQNRNVALTSHLIKVKGQSFADRLGIQNHIEFSNGWLHKFQQRHTLKSFKSHGESGSADLQALEHAMPQLQNVIAGYDLANIYNMDETGTVCF